MGWPPAESIAAVDPAAVETLRPLDRQLTKCELASLLLLILNDRANISRVDDVKNISFDFLMKCHTEMRIEKLMLDKDVQPKHHSKQRLVIDDCSS